MRNQMGFGAVVMAMISTALVASATQADDGAMLRDAASRFAAPFVTIKFVLKMEGQFGDRENETEATGVMIEPDGLVLASSSQLGTPRFMRQFGNARPTDLKVLIGDDTEGLPATVMARDTELDLAWVKLKEPSKKKLEYLDLGKSVKPQVGDSLVFLRRMGKYFDRAVTVGQLRVAGKTTKPRELIVPGGGASLEPGLPAFTAQGEVVGFVVLQLPDAEELESNFGAFAGLGRDIGSGLILPTADVVKATERAKRGEIKGDAEESAAGKSESKKKPASDDDEDDDKADASRAKSAPQPKRPANDDDDDEDE